MATEALHDPVKAVPTGADPDASLAQRLRTGDPGVLADLAAAWGPRL